MGRLFPTAIWVLNAGETEDEKLGVTLKRRDTCESEVIDAPLAVIEPEA